MKTYKILFVCLGNICRSPMAEYVLRHEAAIAGVSHRLHIKSAGTSGWHNGKGMHQGTASKLKQHNISSSGCVSSQVTTQDAEEYDYIIALDDNNLADLKPLFRIDSTQTFKLTDLIPDAGYTLVPDPYHTGDFDETYHLVNTASRALLKKLDLLD